jgi:hypothetical protein
MTKSRLGVCGAVALLAAVCLPMTPAPVQAATVTFDLNNVTFVGGGTATGHFDFNSMTNALTNVSITTSTDGSFGATYMSGSFNPGSPDDLFAFSIGGITLDLAVAHPLSLTSPNSLSTSASFEVLVIAGNDRLVTSGSLVPTPLPAALPLFAGGLGVLGLLGWRRKRKAAA